MNNKQKSYLTPDSEHSIPDGKGGELVIANVDGQLQVYGDFTLNIDETGSEKARKLAQAFLQVAEELDSVKKPTIKP